MNISKSFKYIVFFCILCFVFSYANTEIFCADSNGVDVTDSSSGLVSQKHIEHFTAFNPTSTSYIYNEAGETATISGSVDFQGVLGGVTSQVSIPTLGSTSIDVRWEGEVKNSTTWFNIFTKNFTAATTIDYVLPSSEYITNYRVGVKVNTNGTDVISIRTSAAVHK